MGQTPTSLTPEQKSIIVFALSESVSSLPCLLVFRQLNHETHHLFDLTKLPSVTYQALIRHFFTQTNLKWDRHTLDYESWINPPTLYHDDEVTSTPVCKCLLKNGYFLNFQLYNRTVRF